MRFAGHFSLSLAVVVCVTVFARADDLAVASNPYSTITERNIFALVPIPVIPDGPPPVVADPPPKITINGMMTLFGKPQVLLKFTPKAPPGQPTKDVSLVLGEGERDQGVEVTKIDMKGHSASFLNQGVAQDVALSDTAKITAPASGPVMGGGVAMAGAGGGIPMPSVAPGMAAAMMGRGAGGRGAGGVADANSVATGVAGNGQPFGKASIEDEVLNGAKKMAQIELNRIATAELVKRGKMPPLPPTPLTPKNEDGDMLPPSPGGPPSP